MSSVAYANVEVIKSHGLGRDLKLLAEGEEDLSGADLAASEVGKLGTEFLSVDEVTWGEDNKL